MTYARLGTLAVAHCSNVACTASTTATIDAAGEVGGWNAITTGNDGLGLISYLDRTNGALKVAHCSNAACSSATIATLESTGTLYGTAVATGVDGLPLVGYWETDVGLKLIHCSNALCTPYFRRR